MVDGVTLVQSCIILIFDYVLYTYETNAINAFSSAWSSGTQKSLGFHLGAFHTPFNSDGQHSLRFLAHP